MSQRALFAVFKYLVAVCCFYVAASAHAGEGKPVALAEIDTYDFGKVFEGSDVTHAYIIKNTGDADLEIQSVHAG